MPNPTPPTNVRSRANLTASFVEQFKTASLEGTPFAAARQAHRDLRNPRHQPHTALCLSDQVASAFQGYLNAREAVAASGLAWKAAVHWPKATAPSADGAAVLPSALRIYCNKAGGPTDDPDDPKATVYDVYEGYWSPLSKGKVGIVSALRWLLNATFLGTSSTANIPATLAKLLWDAGYVVAMLLFALLACAAALALGLFSWWRLSELIPLGGGASFWAVLQNPLGSVMTTPPALYGEFAVDLLVAYVLAQIVVAYRVNAKRRDRTSELRSDCSDGGMFVTDELRANKFHRTVLWILWGALVPLVAAAFAIAWGQGQLGRADVPSFLLYSALVFLAIGFSQAARAMADFAVANVLGDVEVYTTHDANSALYSVREQIIQSVAGALLGVLSAANAEPGTSGPYYDRIHVLGHSLGSSIGLDVLIRLRQMVAEGAIAEANWNRVRSFTTFGTALEKTRFFFDVRHPTLNAAQDQWENDVYGRFFSNEDRVLKEPDNAGGVYWSNYWYFRDVVANEILSYTSDVKVGATFQWSSAQRFICKNYPLANAAPFWVWIHSDYIADPEFWKALGKVLAPEAS